MYETFRLIKERELVDKSDAFLAIFHQLELVRMGLDKHEIPKDKKLVAPMEMIKIPAGGPEDRYVYDKNDPKRAHIMPTGVSDSGSITWHVIDHINNRHFPVERRAISDQILELWKPKAA